MMIAAHTAYLDDDDDDLDDEDLYCAREYDGNTFPLLIITTYSHLVGIQRVGICWVTKMIIMMAMMVTTKAKAVPASCTNKVFLSAILRMSSKVITIIINLIIIIIIMIKRNMITTSITVVIIIIIIHLMMKRGVFRIEIFDCGQESGENL